ncbi:O-succinylbenzoate synthase [Ectothiorhodospira magna]|uniref:o-succinylbenzoate synthase n=1 Tax=Ectothiorhodospira magna TaxID=867345 RepID=A0A1H9FF42_9GAMM|nr:o-succinylbenzoate synthase [Ectothiorhodospira magna]SEQ36093.1 O-succinylbenzoate synthase [Ectothiorhodospira magna]
MQAAIACHPDIRLWRFSLALRQPLILPGHRLTRREGLLLEWCHPQHASCWSEISPLPGFSAATLDQCLDQLRNIMARRQPLPQRLHDLPPDTAPEVCFGLESGLQQWTRTLPPPTAVPRCRLIRHNDDLDITPSPDCTCLKLKVGQDDPATDIQRIRQITARLGEHQWLRLDANRSWTLDQAVMICGTIDRRRIQFVEEPLRAGSDYRHWWASTGVPFAWDETLREHPDPDLHTPGLGALVIKPMLTGFKRCQSLLRQARSRRLAVVLSAAYESNLTLDLYARLVHHWGLEGAQGLDTFAIFGEALLQPIASQPEWRNLPVVKASRLGSFGHFP